MSSNRTHYLNSNQLFFALTEEGTNTNVIVLVRPWLEPMIYHTLGKHDNYHTIDAV